MMVDAVMLEQEMSSTLLCKCFILLYYPSPNHGFNHEVER